ncbi:response regulator transcription factor [Streptomyces sp. NPDC048297]|uniref:helix-turn-helix transcriptional regulator n=1 Tax=Streptomyces sp. NPDC048297 TaxID=3365531 RepID=UPI00371B0F18
MNRVKVGVVAQDQLTQQALSSYLHDHAEVVLTRVGGDAELVVAAVSDPNIAALTRLRELVNAETFLVLIVDGEWHADIQKALELGTRAVIFRSDFTWERFGEALEQVASGHGDLPAMLQGRLMDQVARTYVEVLEPRGLTSGGLTVREVDVLRLVADGYELQAVGSELGYSERTVKSVLYGVIKRYNLRNRAHAVSYALRYGMI